VPPRPDAPAWRPADRLAALRPRTRAIAGLGAGAVAALGQAPFSIEALGVAGLFAGLALFLAARSWREAFAAGWAFGTGYFALALFWIVEPFLVDIARHGWMAPFALVLMAAGLALFWGAAFAGARAAGGAPVAWAAALALAELARGHVLTGFPWALVGYIWTDSGALQWAAWIGPYGLTLATVLLVALTWTALARARAPWLLAAPLPFAAFAFSGAALAPPPQDLAGRPVVRLVQPNAPQDEKWDPDRVLEFYQRQIGFTAVPGDPPPDLIVWPESAIPWPLDVAGPVLGEIAAAASGIPVVLGLNRREDGRWFNSLILVDRTGGVAQLYDKHHLVPFGEYIPFGHLTRSLGLRSFAAQDGYGYSAGPGPRLLDLPGIGATLPLICYEAIFPGGVRRAPDRPDLLLQITNDAWFGEISGPYQHLAQARVRAVEQGLPMVRVANTGVSAVIDPAGRILAGIPLGEAGFLDHPVPAPRPPTLYARMGDLPALGLIVALLAGAALRRRLSH
jgi:apolipoprotein N-acyltransferase